MANLAVKPEPAFADPISEIVLCRILIDDASVFPKVNRIVQAEDFEYYRDLYAGIKSKLVVGEPAELQVIAGEFPDHAVHIFNACGSPQNAEYIAGRVKEFSRKRDLTARIEDASIGVGEQSVGETIACLRKIVQIEDFRDNELPSIGKYVTANWAAEHPAPIKYQVDRRFARDEAHNIASLGGVGKTHNMLDLAVRYSLYPYADMDMYWMGGKITDGGKVVFFTAEDGEDNLKRRLWNLYPNGEWRNSNFILLPLVNMKLAHRPMFAKVDGVPTRTAMWEWVREEVGSLDGVAAVFFDTAQKISALDLDKDNTDAQFLATSMGELAAENRCGVYQSVHMNKAAIDAEEPEEVRKGIRGATAIVDGMRLSYAIWPVNRKKAEDIINQLMLDCWPKDIVRGMVVKENFPVLMDMKTFKREKSGAFSDITKRVQTGVQNRSDALPEDDVYENVVRFLQKEAESARYYTRNKLREAREAVRCGDKRLAGYITQWVHEKRLREVPNPTGKGLVVMPPAVLAH